MKGIKTEVDLRKAISSNNTDENMDDFDIRSMAEKMNKLQNDMEKQNLLYKPTSFWQYGSKLLIDELEQNNIEDFRKLTVTRNFFVPDIVPLSILKIQKNMILL